jgi:hypothetical protein
VPTALPIAETALALHAPTAPCGTEVGPQPLAGALPVDGALGTPASAVLEPPLVGLPPPLLVVSVVVLVVAVEAPEAWSSCEGCNVVVYACTDAKNVCWLYQIYSQYGALVIPAGPPFWHLLRVRAPIPAIHNAACAVVAGTTWPTGTAE